MDQLLTWFEIPSTDLARAAAFYSAVLGTHIPIDDVGGHPAAVLRTADGTAVGGIRCSPEHMLPSRDGPNLYLSVGDIDASLRAAVEHGGEIVLPHTDAGSLGAFAWIVDSEGNRVALNQPRGL